MEMQLLGITLRAPFMEVYKLSRLHHVHWHVSLVFQCCNSCTVGHENELTKSLNSFCIDSLD